MFGVEVGPLLPGSANKVEQLEAMRAADQETFFAIYHKHLVKTQNKND